MFNPDHNASPFNALPPVVILGALAMAVVEVIISAGGAGYVGGPQAVGWRLAALEQFAFSGPYFEWMMGDGGRITTGGLLRFVTYPFVHSSFTHMLFAAVITLALGKFVGEVFRSAALVAIWLATTICAALVYAVGTDSTVPLYGGMPGAYGLIGAFTFILWQRARTNRSNPWLAFRMFGFLLILQVVFATMEGGIGPHIVAELAAFAAGFAVSFLVSPGGWTAVLSGLRQR
jgi:membrane associated rhomboid family serine protease